MVRNRQVEAGKIRSAKLRRYNVLRSLRNSFLAIAVLIFSGCATVESQSGTLESQLNTGLRLTKLLKQRNDYIVWIGVPLNKPTRWQRAVAKGELVIVDGKNVSLNEIKSFVVAYPSGSLVDGVFGPTMASLPPGVKGMDITKGQLRDVLTDSDIKAGNQYMRVTYGPSTNKPNDPNCYSTSLHNISKHRVKIQKFGGYNVTPSGTYILNNLARRYYSDKEFKEWYGQQTDWLEPGATATDHNNYGGRPVLWAYHCQSDDGKTFIAGAVLP
jgi:hypothetical protein